MLTESNFRKSPDHFRAFPCYKDLLQRLKTTSVEKQHVFQETWLKQGQPFIIQS